MLRYGVVPQGKMRQDSWLALGEPEGSRTLGSPTKSRALARGASRPKFRRAAKGRVMGFRSCGDSRAAGPLYEIRAPHTITLCTT